MITTLLRLAPVLSLAMLGFAQAAPEYVQLRVTLDYTRQTQIKNRLGPDNYEKGEMKFTLNAAYDVLAEKSKPSMDEVKWPDYFPSMSYSAAHGTARLTGWIETDHPVGKNPKRTEIDFTGAVDRDQFYLNSFASAYPMSQEPRAQVGFAIPLKGKVTGAIPDQAAEFSVNAFRMSPVRVREEEGVMCEGEINFIPALGERPKDEVLAQAYDMAAALEWKSAEIPGFSAPCLTWKDAKIEQGTTGSWRLIVEKSVTWPLDEGTCTDKVKFTIEPVKRTLATPPPEQ